MSCAWEYTVFMSSISDSPVPVSIAELDLPMIGSSVQCGFPSPAEDFQVSRLDLTSLLIRHPQATFFFRAAGTSMIEAGIDHGDLLAVDRAITPANRQIVVAIVDGEFTVKYLQIRAGRLRLKAANSTFPDIVPRDGQTIEVWGVVTACIKLFKV